MKETDYDAISCSIVWLREVTIRHQKNLLRWKKDNSQHVFEITCDCSSGCSPCISGDHHHQQRQMTPLGFVVYML